MNSPRKAWETLAKPAAPSKWTATSVTPVVRVARTSTDGAALVVRLGADTERRYGLRTAHIDYSPNRDLLIEGEDDTPQRYLVLECDGKDSVILGRFLDIVDSLTLRQTNANDFDEQIRSVFELFRAFSARSTGPVQGLWAELFVISRAADPTLLVRAWHSTPDDLHDFKAGADRLEVKSSAQQVREHEFSLEQLERDPENTVIASVLLREAASGANVFDLRDEVFARLSDSELRLRVEAVINKTLGDQYVEASDVRFDVPFSTTRVAFYPALSVPRVATPLPVGVRNVTFCSDLSSSTRVAKPYNHSLLEVLA